MSHISVKLERRLLDSHDDLVKNFRKFSSAHELLAVGDFEKALPALKKRIADFRDYQIAHAKSPRTMHLTIWGADKKPRLATTRLYPKADEAKDLHRESEGVEALMILIGEYLSLLTALIVANRGRSKFLIY